MRATVLLIIALLALAALAFAENRPLNSGMPIARSGFPTEQRVVIPWVLNTRCSINSGNLPQRDPERNA
jgi:hypothetical protein